MRWLPHPPPMLDASPTCTDVGRAKNLRLRFPVGISDKNHERRAASVGESFAGPGREGDFSAVWHGVRRARSTAAGRDGVAERVAERAADGELDAA